MCLTRSLKLLVPTTLTWPNLAGTHAERHELGGRSVGRHAVPDRKRTIVHVPVSDHGRARVRDLRASRLFLPFPPFSWLTSRHLLRTMLSSRPPHLCLASPRLASRSRGPTTSPRSGGTPIAAPSTAMASPVRSSFIPPSTRSCAAATLTSTRCVRPLRLVRFSCQPS